MVGHSIKHHVVENALHLLVAARLIRVRGQQVVSKLQRVLRASHFGGVQTAIDMDNGLALAGQGAGLIFGEAFRRRKAPRNLAVPIHARQIALGGNQRDVVRASLRRGTHRHQLHLRARRIKCPEVLDRVVVRGQLEIRPGLEPDHRLRRGNSGLGGQGG